MKELLTLKEKKSPFSFWIDISSTAGENPQEQKPKTIFFGYNNRRGKNICLVMNVLLLSGNS